MKDSEVLQFIIDELKDSSLIWKDNRELFELICYPIAYGTEYEKQRDKAKRAVFRHFLDDMAFDRERFSLLVKNITCSEDEKQHRKEFFDFLTENFQRLSAKSDVDIEQLTKQFPCRDVNMKNYRSHFNHWCTQICDIQDMEVKRRIEKNFDFSARMWGQNDGYQKERLRACVKKFVKQHDMPLMEDIFDEISETFGLKETLSDKELTDLHTIKGMDRAQIDNYIQQNKPLSQLFIIKLIPILYRKGYYQLLLEEGIQKLKPYYYNDKNIKKIYANVLGSARIRRYKEAYEVVKYINPDDDVELLDLQTIAISNVRRYKLDQSDENREEQKEIIHELVRHYDKVFRWKETYHYYPGINLAYMTAIWMIIREDTAKMSETISAIYRLSQKSIQHEKKSTEPTINYYATMSDIEFKLLQNHKSALAELNLFFEEFDQNIPIVELERTQRQMQFFVDSVDGYASQNTIIQNMQKAISIIDDFIEYQAKWE